MGHTPGPWVVVKPNADNPSRAMVGSAKGANIYNAPLTDETEANAHLIAAAPDMFAACEKALIALAPNDGYSGPGAEACKVLRAAIAKAKGQSS